MAKNKQQRGRLLYTLSLCAWALLLIALTAYGLDRVRIYAEEYELSRPGHTMDAYVEALGRDLWDEGIEDSIKSMPHEMQSDEEVAERVREMLSGGISYMRAGGAGEGRASYSLLCGGQVFGTVTLAEDLDYVNAIDTTRFPWRLLPWSIRPWKVESESFDFTGLYSSVDIVVPRSYSVMLNGKRLSNDYIAEKNIPYDVLMDYYLRYDGLPTKVRYRFDNVIGSLNPVILDDNGEEFHIDPEKNDSQYFRVCSEAKLERLAKFTAGFIDRYLRYISGATDSTYGYQRLQPYMLKGSDIDMRMVDMMDGLSWAHASEVKIKSSQLNGAIDLGEGFYVLDITSVSSTYAVGKGEVDSVSNMRVIVRERNDDVRAITLELY